jgi:hypothetical protein
MRSSRKLPRRISVRVMTPADVKRLRGDARPGTHLARYDLANSRNARRVLDEPCPEPSCGAGPGVQCFSGA